MAGGNLRGTYEACITITRAGYRPAEVCLRPNDWDNAIYYKEEIKESQNNGHLNHPFYPYTKINETQIFDIYYTIFCQIINLSCLFTLVKKLFSCYITQESNILLDGKEFFPHRPKQKG